MVSRHSGLSWVPAWAQTEECLEGWMGGWVLLWWQTARDDRIFKIGRDLWNASGPVKKSPITLWAQCCSKCKQQRLCVGDRCFSAAQPAAASLLRCMMQQSPGAFLLILSCLSSFKIIRFVSKTIPQSGKAWYLTWKEALKGSDASTDLLLLWWTLVFALLPRTEAALYPQSRKK